MMRKGERGMLVLLSTALCLTMTACGGTESQGEAESKVESSSSAVEETPAASEAESSSIVEEEEDSTTNEIVLTKDEFKSYLEDVTITTENWQDYFSVEDYSYIGKDEFGEATGAEADEKILVCRENVIPVNSSSENELVLEFTYTSMITGGKMYDKETGEDLSENYSKYLGDQIGYSRDEVTTIHSYNIYDISSMPTDNSEYVSELYSTRNRYNVSTAGDNIEEEYTYDISNFTLNRAKGTVKVSDIPDNKWNTDEEHGRYLIVDFGSDNAYYYYMFENGAAFSGSSPESIDWDSDSIRDWSYAIEDLEEE